MTGETIWLSVLAGLTGAPHCVIMCGGIGASIALEARRSAVYALLAYHCGRIVTYGMTGAVMGTIGSFLNGAGRLAGLQGIASIVGGCLILLWAIRRYELPIRSLRLPGRNKLSTIINGIKPRYETIAMFLTGLMLGLLPCGLTYAMQIRAAATGSWLEGFVTLFAFGLSTIPVLLAVSLTAYGMNKAWRNRLRRLGSDLAVLMGVLTILKGLSANGWVPSVHPWLW
ncbi:sulfite exporter TauE/SafE family protein [Cohnella sp. GCM10027633]|uniref:sulfite exporter TauE/SafE family protein n=1 Tax=unclassified Cohnella TaxID=2636738 RepID=UPI003630227E